MIFVLIYAAYAIAVYLFPNSGDQATVISHPILIDQIFGLIFLGGLISKWMNFLGRYQGYGMVLFMVGTAYFFVRLNFPLLIVPLFLGGLCNCVVIVANGGRMPVDRRLMNVMMEKRASVKDMSDRHQFMKKKTKLKFLGDRFYYPWLFPGIFSIGDIFVGVMITWILIRRLF